MASDKFVLATKIPLLLIKALLTPCLMARPLMLTINILRLIKIPTRRKDIFSIVLSLETVTNAVTVLSIYKSRNVPKANKLASAPAKMWITMKMAKSFYSNR